MSTDDVKDCARNSFVKGQTPDYLFVLSINVENIHDTAVVDGVDMINDEKNRSSEKDEKQNITKWTIRRRPVKCETKSTNRKYDRNESKEYLTTIDANNKNGIIVADSFSTVSESEKQETPTWFLRQKIFLQCDKIRIRLKQRYDEVNSRKYFNDEIITNVIDYGGYLLNMNPMIKKGDIFITVLSMALIVGSISTIITYYYFIKKIIHAALYIRSLQQFDYQYTLIQYGSRHCSTDEVIVTLITAPEFKMPVIPPRGNSIIRFINGTRNVLRNYHNHKLFLLIGFILAIIYGFEYAVYNMLMGQIFKTMLDDTPNIHILTLCAIQLSATGFAVFILRIASTILAAVVSEHMAVSFRVILSRHLLKIADKESFSKLNINTLVDENVSLTSEAKSLYHPYLSELLTRISSMITNIILGFIYSWEITLLGIILIILCLTVQMKMEFEGFNYCCKCTSNQRIQKKTKPLKSYESSMFRAINFSIIQTFGFALKAICYALTAFICYHKYKQQTQAFVSVITLFSASREAVQLPELIRKLYKSWRAVNRIFACMQNKLSRNYTASISRTIRLEY
ncbi:hypothetical protein DINM_001766 [Dirofilaria immitis]|nr:hypothetical protein [Dirofilaria immitis]